MIFEHLTNGGWVGFDTCYVERLKRKIPRLRVGLRVKGSDQINTANVCLIHKNTEFLPDLHRAIGHYLGCRNEQPPSAYFQHEQETSTGDG